jgi:hypothetical protein
VPCQWVAAGGATILRYNVGPYDGAASLRIGSTGANFIMTSISDCVPVSAGTTYNLGFWYRVAAGQLVIFVGFGPIFFSNANCTGSVASPAGAQTGSAAADGSWHALTGQTTATTNPFNAQSAHLEINFTCTATCPAGQSADFDDTTMDSSPTAATVTSFSASRSSRGIIVRWHTGSGFGTLGFNVYRQRGGQRVLLNRHVIPALSPASGRTYSFLDRSAPRQAGLRYWLQEVEVGGARKWHGPVRISSP